MVPFQFERGETISLALDAIEGDPALVSAVAAELKPVAPGRSAVAPGTSAAAVFSVAARAASGDDPGGWTLTIGAASSAGLTAGSYRADARINVGSGVVFTEQVAIRITEPVSAP